jgi:hypothetical protein
MHMSNWALSASPLASSNPGAPLTAAPASASTKRNSTPGGSATPAL